MTDYFKELARKYDNESSIAISEGVAGAISKVSAFDATKTKALDLGCGTGLLSAQIAPQVASLTAVDVSASMLELLSEKIRRGDIPGDKVTPKEVDLLDPAVQAEFAGKFDAVVSALAYHHIPDFDGITKALFTVLKPGGKVYIADLREGGRSIHGNMTDEQCEEHGVSARNGFSAEFMQELFTRAGFKNYEAHEFTVDGWGPTLHTKDHTGKTGKVRELHGETQYNTLTDLLLSVAEK